MDTGTGDLHKVEEYGSTDLPTRLEQSGQVDHLVKVNRSASLAPPDVVAPSESVGHELREILIDWVVHVALFCLMCFIVALLTAMLSWGLHFIVFAFKLDSFLSTGFKHVEYTIFALDALFLIISVLIHTLKTLKRIGTL